MGIDVPAATLVHICYVGVVRRAVRTSEERLRMDAPATLRGLLDGLVARHGDALRDHVLDAGELSRAATVLIDGRNCRGLGGLDAPIDAGSEVEVIVFGPPANGG